tara:strand:+ start:666 stop:1397 length:732 start_codon:yes stop_codon:yes gene_type:complete
MIKRIINISIYFIFLTNTILLADQEISKSYTIYIKLPLVPKISFQNIDTKLDFDEKFFTYSYNVETINNLDFIKSTESTGFINGQLINGNYYPDNYNNSSIRGDQKRSIHFEYLENQIKFISVIPPYDKNNLSAVTESMLINSIDPITLFLKLTDYDYVKNCDVIFNIYDGKRRYDIILSNKSEEQEFFRCKLEQKKIGGYKLEKQNESTKALTELVYKKNIKNKFIFDSVEFKDDFFSIIIQ